MGKEIKYGIKFSNKVGNSNGSYKKVSYFSCMYGLGAFVSKSQIQLISSNSIVKDKIPFGSKVYIKHPFDCVGIINYIGPKTVEMKMNMTQSKELKYAKKTYYGIKINKSKQMFVQKVMIVYPFKETMQKKKKIEEKVEDT